MIWRFAFMLVLATAVPPTGLPATGVGRVVASTSSGSILYGMIACDPESEGADCHRYEQQRIDRRIHRVWIDAAMKTYGVTLTPEEKASVERNLAEARAAIERAAKRFHALAVAALRVRRGEDRAVVLADIEHEGIPARDFNWELAHVRTVRDAERAAAKDFVADGERGMREYQVRMHGLGHLSEIVKQRAIAGHVGFETAEERFWSEIARATDTRIIDPVFAMPGRKGILVNR